MTSYYTVEPCASSKAFEIVFKNKRINIEKIGGSKIGEIIAKTPVILVLNVNGKSVSIYASGRIMLKNLTKPESEELAKKLVKDLEESDAID
ncbi:hypothetical protein HYT84_04545 [Candidatus Micrarchaeota archaeon]|nr:hypothetical protein [Candidatus Micrarchaeota archaeon]